MARLKVELPDKLKFLFDDYRYKVALGGRGGGKSWSIALVLLIQSMQRKMLIVCAREIQTSIKDSVHRLLKDQISRLGLHDQFTVTNETITCNATGSEFIFKGLWQNVDNIKSLEGADVVWIEEGNLTSKHTWKKLTPTVRKDGSEIWISYNPELVSDYIHKLFVVDVPPANAKVVQINHSDNPWFPSVLEQERLQSQQNDPLEEYNHVWEGQCVSAIKGAIFENELMLLSREERLTVVHPLAGIPVHTFWDLGESDSTAIWFVQIVGLEFRIVDFYQNNGEKMPHYIDVLADKGYRYGDHCLPHDAVHQQIAAKSTIKQQLQTAIKNNPKLGDVVRIVPRIAKKALAIEAARDIFPRCVFDKTRCNEGIEMLQRYSYARDATTGRVSKQPKHDMYSHPADAFLTFAQHYRKPQPDKPKNKPKRRSKSGWMGN